MKTDYLYFNPGCTRPELRVERQDFPSGKKKFSQSHFDGEAWHPGGTKSEIAPYTYEKWRGKEEPIFIVEGEKCVEELNRRGLSATTTPGGAKSWKPNFAPFFKDRDIIILPDNDKAGNEYARAIIRDLFPVAKSIKNINLPDLAEKEDVIDFLQRRTIDDLRAIVNAAPVLLEDPSTILYSKSMIEFEAKEINWLWCNRIPYGCITLLEGDGGIGKSFIALDIASKLSRGEQLPESNQEREPSASLIFSAEDDPRVVLRPRLDALGADLNLIYFYDNEAVLNEDFYKQLELEIRTRKIKLIVVDPIVAFLDRDIDTSKSTDVRSFMKVLHGIAAEFECAILIIRHWNKSVLASAAHRGAGSVDFRNAARSVLQVIKREDDRYVCLEKSNYGSSCGALKFQMESNKVVWLGSEDLSPDDLLGSNDNSSNTLLEEAMNFLDQEIDGCVESKKVSENARIEGISERSLKLAKKKMGIASVKKGTSWWLERPPENA